MADTLYRYDEPTQQWAVVSSVNRIEVSGGGILSSQATFSLTFLMFDFPYNISDIEVFS